MGIALFDTFGAWEVAVQDDQKKVYKVQNSNRRYVAALSTFNNRFIRISFLAFRLCTQSKQRCFSRQIA